MKQVQFVLLAVAGALCAGITLIFYLDGQILEGLILTPFALFLLGSFAYYYWQELIPHKKEDPCTPPDLNK